MKSTLNWGGGVLLAHNVFTVWFIKLLRLSILTLLGNRSFLRCNQINQGIFIQIMKLPCLALCLNWHWQRAEKSKNNLLKN